MSALLARFADLLGVTQQELLDAVQEHTAPQQDTRVALTVEEAARRLGVGRTTMYALVASGEVESVQIGRLRRVPVRALDSYVNARTQASASTVALAA
ncbi:helix-turn-helix domain-containing protein [Streptantibioticus ferralitis]|uniref:Helix-turn-helix domain-containing protein n=1 Tax=Streptantibioticus ferralitis TaxID=236510 RepID=A0ABT5Z0H2_9ACTN|nr:helix-turn-helix domain-containing protein [Streptantibioticus ferralitis]MDF2257333.1 helix-turn-helix domain-containing protein [Streptantibioticus ferralitis]